MVYKFASTSKITFPGSGIAAIATSLNNLEEIKAQLTYQTIGHDKVNQLRHVRFFGNIDNMKEHMKKHAAIEPSMLQDLKKNKPCEIDAINGVVCDWGRKKGIPTPVSDRIVEIVHEIQDGKRKPAPENLKEI